MSDNSTDTKKRPKVDYVREALRELGNNAKPTAISEWIERKYSVHIEPKHCSMYKHNETKAKKPKPRAAVKKMLANGHANGTLARVKAVSTRSDADLAKAINQLNNEFGKDKVADMVEALME